MLDAAAAQFRVHGFADTSTEQLCEAAGVGRSSLYNTFTSKDELFVRALERYIETTGAAQGEVLENIDLDGMARLRGVLDVVLAEEAAAAANGQAAGCMVAGSRMTPDLEYRDSRIAHILDRGLEQQISLLAQAVHVGQHDGTIRAGIPIRDAALLVVSIISGVRVIAQTGSPPEEQRRIAMLSLDALRP
ncbi:TetR/AcrR family transcriptional regulator [uncultured Schumannella sp.]|uniref:TetR/AcrR family transcriptional regulator n=1 Tax=uncultured Schumannella sp. TaxID=1195956 RepID=UPI0025EF33ED|nr:TetR/AcrR family transcriptional regulator [uncultured Schumannella sp.]